MTAHRARMGSEVGKWVVVKHPSCADIGGGRRAVSLLRETHLFPTQEYAFSPSIQLAYEKKLFEQGEELEHVANLAKSRDYKAPRLTPDLVASEGLLEQSKSLAR